MKTSMFVSLLGISVLALQVSFGAMATDTNPPPMSATMKDRSEKMVSSDQTITQDVQKALRDDKTLSTDAKNISVSTLNGDVTLRGSVKSDAEKAKINSIVQNVTGVKNVHNELNTK